MNLKIPLIYLSILGLCQTFAQEFDEKKAITFIRDALKNYDKAFRPNNKNDVNAPLDVAVMIDILSYGQFNARTMKYSLLLEVEQVWNDPRLADTSAQSVTDTINISGELDRIWVPDVYFPKSVEGHLHDVTVKNSLVWLEPSGQITFVQKLSVTLGCTLDLSRFPMDNQKCTVDIGSFGFRKSDMNLIWRYGDDKAEKNIILKKRSLNEFLIIRIESTSEETCGDVDGSPRPCIQAKFYFRRELQYHFMHTYGPNILIVVISWLSFLIDFTVAPARTALGLIAVLALITQTNMVYSDMPKVSYIKAIDIWLLACLLFVVGALLEFVFVNSLCREGTRPIITIKDKIVSGVKVLKRRKEDQPTGKDDIEATDEAVAVAEPKQSKKKFTFQKSTGYKIDGFFFVIYPIIFIIFNIVYWSIYLSLEE